MPSRGKRRSRSSSEPKYTSANSPKTPDEVAWDHNIDRKKLFGMNKGNAPQYSALTNVRVHYNNKLSFSVWKTGGTKGCGGIRSIDGIIVAMNDHLDSQVLLEIKANYKDDLTVVGWKKRYKDHDKVAPRMKNIFKKRQQSFHIQETNAMFQMSEDEEEMNDDDDIVETTEKSNRSMGKTE
eukprot:439733_1